MWEFSRHSKPKANKTHRCEECYKTINIKDTYNRIDGVCEGEFISYKAHENCSELTKRIYIDNDYGPYEEHPRLTDYIYDHKFREIYWDEFKDVFARFGIIREAKQND